MQFQADMVNVPVVRPKVIERRRCVPLMRGAGVGYWHSTAPPDIVQNWGVDRRWHPHMDAAQREHLYSSWNKAVDRSLGWAG